jgi:hypothetical protein
MPRLFSAVIKSILQQGKAVRSETIGKIMLDQAGRCESVFWAATALDLLVAAQFARGKVSIWHGVLANEMAERELIKHEGRLREGGRVGEAHA